MTGWFVSTTRAAGADVEWLLEEWASEEEARVFAFEAIVRGLRVEAGTVPGVAPRRRIDWTQARNWASASTEGTLVDLSRRLAQFAKHTPERLPTRSIPPAARRDRSWSMHVDRF